MLQIFIYFYMIKAFAIRDILKWEDIIHFLSRFSAVTTETSTLLSTTEVTEYLF